MAGPQPAPARQRSALARLVAIAIVLALLVAFYIENRKSVRLSFILFHHTSKVSWLLLVSSVLGFVVGWLVHGRFTARRGARSE